MAFEPNNLLIVGAGFSSNAGLPLASNFTQALLNVHKLKIDGPSARQVKFICKFVDRTFGEGSVRTAKDWPELEDIFTMVDLSANTGHHLGPDYSASQLRVVRRAIIVRMIRMLQQMYLKAERSPTKEWNALETFFERFDIDNSAVLSMNWDTVFEQGIARTQKIHNVDYSCDAHPFQFKAGRLVKRALSGQSLRLLKPHGSVNWLYCDACREMFWVRPSEYEQVAQTLFRTKDWNELPSKGRNTAPTILEPRCPHCKGDSLGTRFATFSYRKALDFPMHAAGWRMAEKYLKAAADWVFFGYSMPPADFEFKYLLKRVHVSESVRPRITVITGGGVDAAKQTQERFLKFFGDKRGERFFFKYGLDDAALKHLTDIKVLRSSK